MMLSQLPDELLLLIFQELDLLDLPICRAVSKQFKYLIDKIDPIELIVDRKQSLLQLFSGLLVNNAKECDRWFNTDRSINLRNRIFVSKFSSLRLLPFSLINLKFLRITTKICIDDSSLSILNDLINLEHFEVANMRINCQKKETNQLLVLPSLRTLFINNIEYNSLNKNLFRKCLQIDAIRLRNLHTYSELKLIDPIHSDTIECLEIEFYHNDNLSSYHNVKCFKCNNCITLQPNLIASLPALEELYCEEVTKNHENHSKGDYFEIESIIDGLIKERIELKKEYIKIYFNGIELNAGPQKFKDYGFYTDYGLNYEDTNNCSSIYESSMDESIYSSSNSSSSIEDSSSLDDSYSDHFTDDCSVGSLILSNSSLSGANDSDLINSSQSSGSSDISSPGNSLRI